MPLIGFKSRFARGVENGVAAARSRPLPHRDVAPKRQTIRARRRDGRDPKVGDTLYLYTGLRTKAVRNLGEVQCRRVERLRIDRRGARVQVDGRALERRGLLRLARADGFTDVDEMIAFLEDLHGLPFRGFLIRW